LTIFVSPQSLPALVLNADYRPLSYYPLSLWSWQDAVKAVFLERVQIVAEYDHAVSSPTFSMRLPSVVCLKTYIKPSALRPLPGSMSSSGTVSSVNIADHPTNLHSIMSSRAAAAGRPPGKTWWRRARHAI
jgi:hypothetical protein